MNKRGLEDSLFTWIAFLFIIIFVMVLHNFIVSAIFLTKGTDKASFEENSVDLIANAKFLNFLNSRILINEKEDKVIDVLRFSLDPYFSIKNKSGESFIEVYGIDYVYKVIQEPPSDLDILMIRDGFDETSFEELERMNYNTQNSQFINEIISKLDNYCLEDSRYFLETPYWIIDDQGLKGRSSMGDEATLQYDYNEYEHNTVYLAENLKIKLWVSKKC